MLTKRTHILFDEEVWNKLVKMAQQEKSSVGELIRTAVEEKFAQQEILRKRRQAFEAILKHRPKPYPGKIDYKELINAGRKVY
jgi:predicted CopG family antitoxin